MVPVNPGLFLKITGTGIIITKKGPGVTDRDPGRLLLLTIVITSLEICKVKLCGTNLFVKIIKEDLFILGGNLLRINQSLIRTRPSSAVCFTPLKFDQSAPWIWPITCNGGIIRKGEHTFVSVHAWAHTIVPRHVCAHTHLYPDMFVPRHVCALACYNHVPRHIFCALTCYNKITKYYSRNTAGDCWTVVK